MTYAAWALGMGRGEAEALMTDSCRIERESGRTVDPDTGQSVPSYSTVYEGKCRLQSRGEWSTDRDIGEAGLTILQVELQVPIGVAPRINDRVTMLSAAFNPDLPGTVWTVRGDPGEKSHNTSRKVMLQQFTG